MSEPTKQDEKNFQDAKKRNPNLTADSYARIMGIDRDYAFKHTQKKRATKPKPK